MNLTLRAKTLSITINSAWREIFEFLANPENLPRWNRGFCHQIRKQGEAWMMESPEGQVRVQLLSDHFSGVLDQRITPPTGDPYVVPLRVLENGSGGEVVLTIFRNQALPDRDFQKLLSRADQGLRDLRRLLESSAGSKTESSTKIEFAEQESLIPSIGEEPLPTREEPISEPMDLPPDALAPFTATPVSAEEQAMAETPLTGSRLYVGNLPYDWTDEQLRAHFESAGAIKEAEVARMGRRGRSRGFGFVEMEQEADAQRAIEQLHGSSAGTRAITVRLSKPKAEKPPRTSAGQTEVDGNRRDSESPQTSSQPRPPSPRTPGASPRSSRRGPRRGGRPSSATQQSATPARRQDSHRRRLSVHESAHVDQDEPVLETGGYYFVPRRRAGSDAPPAGEAVESSLPPRPRRGARRESNP